MGTVETVRDAKLSISKCCFSLFLNDILFYFFREHYNGNQMRYSKRHSVHGIWWLSAGIQLHTGRDELARSRELFSAQHCIDAQHQTSL